MPFWPHGRVNGSASLLPGFAPGRDDAPDTSWLIGCPFFVASTLEGWLSTTERERRTRVNRQIRISPVRVITGDGEQLGVMPIDQALAAAEERGLDLVEVAPTARPPVVKIMDYGKYKFEEAKAARAAKKKQHIIQIKEVKYRPGIDDHDFDFKTRHAREFLEEGNKVKVTMMYRGRQMAHVELGKAVLDRVAAELADVCKVESEAKLEGRNMIMVLAPK
ncbi:MAG: translation initiation factor IF-3 [Gemmatimonadales bacterium]